jgi:hypothetical protein
MLSLPILRLFEIDISLMVKLNLLNLFETDNKGDKY